LLVPFAIYNLTLKASNVASRPEKVDLARTFKLMRSDVFFNLGYALLWLGLFGAVRRREPLRRAVVFLFHATSVIAVIIRASAHEYFRETGTALDYDIVALWLPRPKDVKQMTPLSTWVLLAAALFYATLGPGLCCAPWAGGGDGRRDPRRERPEKYPILVLSGLCSRRSVSARSRC
jgi:lipoteichoic acid synthase